ncbi:hypothetical protein GCM10010295_00250 [Streptomyces intermedius]
MASVQGALVLQVGPQPLPPASGVQRRHLPPGEEERGGEVHHLLAFVHVPVERADGHPQLLSQPPHGDRREPLVPRDLQRRLRDQLPGQRGAALARGGAAALRGRRCGRGFGIGVCWHPGQPSEAHRTRPP